MSRFTRKESYGYVVACQDDDIARIYTPNSKVLYAGNVIDKLADYENIGEPYGLQKAVCCKECELHKQKSR